MNNKDLSRREFIQRISLFGAAGIGAGTLLAACGGGEQQSAAPAAPAAEAPAAADAGFSCDDVSGLTEVETNLRNQLQYVDESPEAGKTCDNCALYQAATEGQCGTCTVVKGPIHPNGYCTSWAQKPA